MSCFDSSQFNITWISNINDIPRVMVLLSYFSRYRARCTDVRTYGQLKCWITKFSRYWAPLARLRGAGAPSVILTSESYLFTFQPF